MQVRTFKAPTMERALAQVKKELGPDAIILNSRQERSAAGETGFEVTAARDQQSLQAGASNPEGGRNDISADMQTSIEEIKGFLSLLISSKDYFSQLQMQQPVAEIYHSLLTRGFDEKQIYSLLNKVASDLDGGGASDKRRIFDAFCARFFAKIRIAKPFRSIPHTSGAAAVFTFVGPTGVGKTTTLAKLAAYLKIKRQLDLGIVSIDTYRIGAVDQLQTYANILDIPFSVAQSKKEFANAREEFRHSDVILVDTTGRNFLNRDHVRDLQALFDEGPKVNHFLVLSSTAKDEDVRQTIFHFREVDIHSLIFTKLDETIHHGCMLNQLLRFNYPISYLGTGQRVPEDVEPATQKRILSFLLPVRNQNA